MRKKLLHQMTLKDYKNTLIPQLNAVKVQRPNELIYVENLRNLHYLLNVDNEELNAHQCSSLLSLSRSLQKEWSCENFEENYFTFKVDMVTQESMKVLIESAYQQFFETFTQCEYRFPELEYLKYAQASRVLSEQEDYILANLRKKKQRAYLAMISKLLCRDIIAERRVHFVLCSCDKISRAQKKRIRTYFHQIISNDEKYAFLGNPLYFPERTITL